MDTQSKRDQRDSDINSQVSCKNCGHEYHEGSLYKEFADGDGKIITIEVCKQGR